MISAHSVGTEQRLPAPSRAVSLRFTLGSFIPRMSQAGLSEVRFRFDFEGTKVVFQGEGGLRDAVRIAA